jgi:hypothetical protein
VRDGSEGLVGCQFKSAQRQVIGSHVPAYRLDGGGEAGARPSGKPARNCRRSAKVDDFEIGRKRKETTIRL